MLSYKTLSLALGALAALLTACSSWNPPPFAHPAHLAQRQEAVVNSQTQGNQLAARLDMNAAGQAVLLWSSQTEGGAYQLYAQRYGPSGQAQGKAILVSSDANATLTATAHVTDYAKAVSIGPQGAFVVAWTSAPVNQRGQSVYVRPYNAQGQAQTDPILVEFVDSYESLLADVALLPDGGFAVSWARSFDSLSDEVLLQRYAPGGKALGEPLRVNSYTQRSQSNPALSVDALGRMVVVWESMGQDGSAAGIYAQRFDAKGQRLGTEFQVHQSTEAFQVNADVAHDGQGRFWVVWSSEHPVSQFLPGANHIFARRYNAQGIALGSEMKVSAASQNAQYPAIAMNSLGQTVIAWEDADGGGAESLNDPLLDAGIFARRYDAQGRALGKQFLVNQHRPFVQQNPAAGINALGEALLAWTSDLQDGDGLGVFRVRLRGK